MIQIALCDDDKGFLEELRSILLQWKRSEREQTVLTVKAYSDSAYFLDTLREKSFDLVFLDIEMPRCSGMEIARVLHERFPHCLIVFLTSHSEYLEAGYEVRAFRYLNKLTVREKLPRVLEAACREIEKTDTRCLTVQRYSDFQRIPFREIVYVCHVLRHCEITLASGEKLKDNRGLKEILAQLNSDQFVQIDRSSIVNLDFVRQLKAGSVILSTGEGLAISRQKLPLVKESISRVWGKTL